MNGRDYIPRADGAFDAWQANYVQYALDHSPALGLTHAEVKTLENRQTDWRKNYGNIADARAYLASIVAAKDDARAAFEQFIRRLSGRMRADPAIDDAILAALGLTIPDLTPSPVPPPATAPLLTIDAALRRVHRLRFVDSASPLRRGKPKGVIGIELRRALTTPHGAVPADPAAFSFIQLATRSPARIEFPGDAAGMTACYIGRWLSTKAQPGPWSATASATVGG